jgi:NCAIR mutase (PurE)-related protein
MREILEEVAAGKRSPAASEAALRGYATGDAGRFDAARETRRGGPEAVLGDGKTPVEVAALVETAVETTGRALATRVDEDAVAAVREALDETHPDADVEHRERARTLVAHAADFGPPDIDARSGWSPRARPTRARRARRPSSAGRWARSSTA